MVIGKKKLKFKTLRIICVGKNMVMHGNLQQKNRIEFFAKPCG